MSFTCRRRQISRRVHTSSLPLERIVAKCLQNRLCRAVGVSMTDLASEVPCDIYIQLSMLCGLSKGPNNEAWIECGDIATTCMHACCDADLVAIFHSRNCVNAAVAYL